MTSYYYMTQKGEFVDSSSPLSDPKYIRINEQEYIITRLLISRYTREEINKAVERVFAILEGKNG